MTSQIKKIIDNYFNPIEDKINKINKYIPKYSGKLTDVFIDSENNIIITYERTSKTHGMLSSRLINEDGIIVCYADHNKLSDNIYTLGHIFTNENQRHKGYATILLKYAIRYGLDNGFKRFIWSSQDEKSNKLYEKIGMRKVGTDDYNMIIFEFNESEAQKFVNT